MAAAQRECLHQRPLMSAYQSTLCRVLRSFPREHNRDASLHVRLSYSPVGQRLHKNATIAYSQLNLEPLLLSFLFMVAQQLNLKEKEFL